MKNNLQEYQELINTMPDYVMKFFAAKYDKYQMLTKIGYARDLKIFFQWMSESYENCKDMKSISFQDIERLNDDDINMYLAYLTEYQVFNPQTNRRESRKNSPYGKERKLAALRVFFRYLRQKNYISHDPCELVDSPTVRKNKAILTLSDDQVDIMLKKAIQGEGKPYKKGKSNALSGDARTKALREKTKYRDFAILSTFLGTGIRVSELVNIDIFDIDFNEQSILVTRKGGSRDLVYFNSDVLNAIADYMDLERNDLLRSDEAQDADNKDDMLENGPLFIARGGNRITMRRVQQIVKEYSVFAVAESQKVSPHVLRKTFGTELYRKYRDLSLTQNALGHAHSSTTTEYYVKFDKERLKVIRDDK